VARARWTAILLTLVLSASLFALPALGAPKASDLGGGAQKAGKAGGAPGHNKDQTSPDDQSPGDEEEAEPSPSPQPSASPSAPPKGPTGTEGQGPGDRGSRSQDEVDSAEAVLLTTSISALPSTILVGEASQVVAHVANTGDSTASNLTVDISVPSQLDITDAGPEPFESVSGGDTIRFHLGSLPAGESAEAWLDLEGAHQTSPSGATVAATATSGEIVSSASARIVVGGSTGNENLALTTSSNRLLVQLGQLVNYSITVTNVGDTTLHDVAVVDRLPAEIRYHSVAFTPVVDAVQVGESGGKQDIVWVKDSLRPGRSITVTWTGCAASLGDFAAFNSVTVKADEVRPVNGERTTYLGTAAVSSTSNPTFDPIVKARRIERTITKPVGGDGTQGSLLPITGLENPTPLVVALVLIALGGLVLWSRRWQEPSRKWTAIALALVLTASAACVDGDPNATATKPDAGQSENEPKKDKKKKEEVRGRRIQKNGNKNGNGNGNGDGGQTGAEPGGDPSSDPVAPSLPPATGPVVAAPVPTTPIPTEQVTVTRRVVTTVGLGDLPIDVLGARPSDNQMSYTWNEAAGKITRATSSVGFTKGATVELMTELGFGGDQIDVTVVVRNLSRNRRLAVNGNLIHDVSGSSGSIASFSAPVDTVLAPGGEVSARFTYLLPSGDYDATARFQPN